VKEKAATAGAETAQMRKQVEALQTDKTKLEGEVGELKEEKQKAVDNWKNWAKKAEERKTKNTANEKERDDLKNVAPLPPFTPLPLSTLAFPTAFVCMQHAPVRESARSRMSLCVFVFGTLTLIYSCVQCLHHTHVYMNSLHPLCTHSNLINAYIYMSLIPMERHVSMCLMSA